MATRSKIDWTNSTWNVVTGCNKVSQGCKNCYAEVMHGRLMKMQPKKYNRPFLDGAFPHEPSLEIPLHWKKPQMIFVNSMSDLFHENIPFEFIDKIFAIMVRAEQHTYQILTKRPIRMLEYFSQQNLEQRWEKYIRPFGLSYPVDGWFSKNCNNIWLGVSVEDQQTADERISLLLQIPAAVRFISAEPLLGPIELWNDDEGVLRGCGIIVSGGMSPSTPDSLPEGYDDSYPGIDWVICGGESGKGARPMHPAWVRKIRDDCKAAGVPFFFKQWGAHIRGDQVTEETFYNSEDKDTGRELDPDKFYKVSKKKAGRLLDGVLHDEFPKEL